MASILSSDNENESQSAASKQPAPRPRPKPKRISNDPSTPSRKRSRDGTILSPSKETDAFFSNSTRSWAAIAVESSEDEMPRISQSKSPKSSKPKPTSFDISSGESSKANSPIASQDEFIQTRSPSHTPPLSSDILERVGSAIQSHVAGRADLFAHVRSQSPDIISPSVLNAELAAKASKLVPKSTDDANSDEIVVIAVTSGFFLVDPGSDPDIIGPKPIRVGIKMRVHQPFQKVCDEIARIWERKLQVILVTEDKRRIFPHSSPANLHLQTGSVIHVYAYTGKGFQILEEQEQKEREKRMKNIGKAETDVTLDLASSSSSSSSAAMIRLTLRSQDDKDVKIRIAKTSVVNEVISSYKRIQNLPSTAKVNLVLDGETIDQAETIDGLDLDDGDMLEVRLT